MAISKLTHQDTLYELPPPSRAASPLPFEEIPGSVDLLSDAELDRGLDGHGTLDLPEDEHKNVPIVPETTGTNEKGATQAKGFIAGIIDKIRPTRTAKAVASTKIRKGSETGNDDEDDDGGSDAESNESSKSDADESPPTTNDAPRRPSRRAKSAAIQKLAKGHRGDEDEVEENTAQRLRGTKPDQRDPPEDEPEESPVPSSERNGDESLPSSKKRDAKPKKGSANDSEEREDDESRSASKKDAANADSKKDAAKPKAPGKERKKRKTAKAKTEDSVEEVEDGNEPTNKRKRSSARVKKEDSVEKEGDGNEPTNKRKRSSARAKTEDAIKEEGDENPPKKKPKRRRVSEAIVKDAAEKMLEVLILNYKDDIKELPMDILAQSITSKKGVPYTNHRSDAIMEGMKFLKAEQKAERVPGQMPSARLLPPEIAKIPKEEISKDPAKVLEQRLKQFLGRLAKNPKGGNGKAVVKAANDVWKTLADGKAYDRKELVAVTAYKAANSSGFEAIMKVLAEMKFIERNKGSCSFTDKVFPHGRP